VEDATKAFEETTKRGAKPFMEPTREEDAHGHVVRSGIYTYGETVHIFVERKNYSGVFLPGYKKWESEYNPKAVGLKYIDHMVGNVGWNEMNKWCGLCANYFFRRQRYFYRLHGLDVQSDVQWKWTY
jgi:4-hydroxyphenylpyruvate dioxygenase